MDFSERDKLYIETGLMEDMKELKVFAKENSVEIKNNNQSISKLYTEISVLKQKTEDHLSLHAIVSDIKEKHGEITRSWKQYIPSLSVSAVALIIAIASLVAGGK